jgi:serine/threonine-protein kinase
LVNAADGYHLWSGRYDRELDDVFAVQDDIARAIVGRLKIRLMGPTGAPLVRRPTDNLEAYQLYLKGRYLYARRYTVGPEPALKCYARAVEAAPEFPAALAGLADCYTVTGLFSLAPIPEMLPKAKAAIERALAVDEACAEAHHALGALHLFLEWNWPAHERAMTRALALNPNLTMARLYYSIGLAMMGRADEAIREAETAISIDPLSAFVASLAGGTYYLLGMNLRALDETERAAELDPHMLLTAYQRALVLSRAGRHDEAIDTAQRTVALTGRSPFMVAVLATVLTSAGRNDEVRALVDELSDRRQRELVSDGVLAVALAAAGERDAALTALERAVANHGGSFPWMLFVHAFDSVRREPRFLQVLEQIGYTGTSAVLLGREC